MPGQLLPLWLLRRSELQTAEAALAAPRPLNRLLIVVSTSTDTGACEAATAAGAGRRSARATRNNVDAPRFPGQRRLPAGAGV
jgi:hypothetical protein